MFEIFGPIFEQNVTINFEPIFEQNSHFGPIFEKSAYFGPIFEKSVIFGRIFEKSVNFEHFVNSRWTHYKRQRELFWEGPNHDHSHASLSNFAQPRF